MKKIAIIIALSIIAFSCEKENYFDVIVDLRVVVPNDDKEEEEKDEEEEEDEDEDKYIYPSNRIISFFEYTDFGFPYDFDFNFIVDSLGTNAEFFHSSSGNLYQKILDSLVSYDTIVSIDTVVSYDTTIINDGLIYDTIISPQDTMITHDTTIRRLVHFFFKTDTARIVEPQYNYVSNDSETSTVIPNIRRGRYYVVVYFIVDGEVYFSSKWSNVNQNEKKVMMYFREIITPNY